ENRRRYFRTRSAAKSHKQRRRTEATARTTHLPPMTSACRGNSTPSQVPARQRHAEEHPREHHDQRKETGNADEDQTVALPRLLAQLPHLAQDRFLARRVGERLVHQAGQLRQQLAPAGRLIAQAFLEAFETHLRFHPAFKERPGGLPYIE